MSENEVQAASTDTLPDQPAPVAGASRQPRIVGVIDAAVALGVVLCGAAVIIGLRMAMHATVSPCPNGHMFPAGTTDFRCFSHRHAGDGTVIVLFAFVLGAILAIAGVTARQLLSRPR